MSTKLTKAMMMLVATVVVGAFFAGRAVNAETADDRKWISQCVADNKGEKGATPEIAQKYCACMNEAMDDNETRTVTQFEKANPKARLKCEQASGWK